MEDIKEIRQRLWHSLDMQYVKMLLFVSGVVFAVLLLMMFMMGNFLNAAENLLPLLIPFLITLGPILGFCVVRTFRIFQHPHGQKKEQYPLFSKPLPIPQDKHILPNPEIRE